jgi:hypothetical protein
LKGLAQVTAAAANPKGDVWFGGTGDPHANGAFPGATVALTLAGHGITLIRP